MPKPPGAPVVLNPLPVFLFSPASRAGMTLVSAEAGKNSKNAAETIDMRETARHYPTLNYVPGFSHCFLFQGRT